MDTPVRAYAKLDRFSEAVLVARSERMLFKQGYGMAGKERITRRSEMDIRIDGTLAEQENTRFSFFTLRGSSAWSTAWNTGDTSRATCRYPH